jgi:hypothetical protein
MRAEVRFPSNRQRLGCRGEESEEESEVLEESPCGRWSKMRAEVRFPRNELSLTTVGV